MDRMKILEESLREASCLGDIDTIEQLLSKGIDINSKHDINGWTPLHWAAKRGHKDVVTLLLANGAERDLETINGETPLALCSRPDIHNLFTSDPGVTIVTTEGVTLPITPNYLRNPPLNPAVDLGNGMLPKRYKNVDLQSSALSGYSVKIDNQQNKPINQSEELVLKVRVSNCGDPDFIEIELPRMDLTYSRLLRTSCEELGVTPTQVFRLRKLPDTIVRKDKDVQRLVDFQEIEIVLACDKGTKVMVGSNGMVGNGGPNSYQSISQFKNQTILY